MGFAFTRIFDAGLFFRDNCFGLNFFHKWKARKIRDMLNVCCGRFSYRIILCPGTTSRFTFRNQGDVEAPKVSIRWQDWGNVILGCWLAVSPWQLGFALNHLASGNACGLGIVLVVFNLFIVGRMVDEGQEILNIILGLWLVLCPFAFGFSSARLPAINFMIVGTATIILACWQIFDAVKEPKDGGGR